MVSMMGRCVARLQGTVAATPCLPTGQAHALRGGSRQQRRLRQQNPSLPALLRQRPYALPTTLQSQPPNVWFGGPE